MIDQDVTEWEVETACCAFLNNGRERLGKKPLPLEELRAHPSWETFKLDMREALEASKRSWAGA